MSTPPIEVTMDPQTRVRSERGVRLIFLRFILVALGLNALLGVGLIAFDVADSLARTQRRLKDDADTLAGLTKSLQLEHPERSPAEAVAEVGRMTGAPLALVTYQGQAIYSTSQVLVDRLPEVAGRPPQLGMHLRVDDSLGALSGAWQVTPFDAERLLVVVISHRPEDEGLLQYMTISAGVLGLGLAISFIVMLGTARWVLHRPLERLLAQLTGTLARDVKRRRRAERLAIDARTEAERLLAFRDNLIDASESVGIIATDSDGTIQIFSRAAERLLGYCGTEVVGQLKLDQLHETISRAATKPVRLRNMLEPAEEEDFLVDKQGREHLVAMSRSAIVDAEGDQAGRLLIFLDVTEQRQLEAELHLNELQLVQSAKMASLGEMATGVAHELNQPLNNIGLLASRIMRRIPARTDEDRQFCDQKLGRIQEQVERASRIIDQLRTFGRPSQKALRPVALAEPVRQAVDMLAEQFSRSDIGLDVDLPTELPEVNADPGQLEQILVNLLLNARDALRGVDTAGDSPPSKRVVIRAYPDSLDGEGPAVALTVQDNGPGMSNDVRQRVFQPFFTTKDPGKGTGLGLSISYGLVQGMRGTLTVESHLGQGTAFTLTLPTANEHPNEDESQNPAG